MNPSVSIVNPRLHQRHILFVPFEVHQVNLFIVLSGPRVSCSGKLVKPLELVLIVALLILSFISQLFGNSEDEEAIEEDQSQENGKEKLQLYPINRI